MVILKRAFPSITKVHIRWLKQSEFAKSGTNVFCVFLANGPPVYWPCLPSFWRYERCLPTTLGVSLLRRSSHLFSPYQLSLGGHALFSRVHIALSDHSCQTYAANTRRLCSVILGRIFFLRWAVDKNPAHLLDIYRDFRWTTADYLVILYYLFQFQPNKLNKIIWNFNLIFFTNF